MNQDKKFLIDEGMGVPLTAEEIRASNAERIINITQELTHGFDFLSKYEKSVTVFGSARLPDGHPYYEKARTVCGRIVTELGYSVFSGGGPGIMEAANRGAYEAGGESLGITIQLPHEQVTNKYLTDQINLYYFFARKVCLSFSAEAYIFFPGGFGTLDEFFEILTLVQTKKIQKVPIILVGSEYWKELEQFIVRHLLDLSTVNSSDLNLFIITDSDDEIVQLVKEAPVRNGKKPSYKHGDVKTINDRE